MTRAYTLLSLVMVLAVFTAAGAFADEWRNEELPQADKSKPLYQWAGWPPPGGMWLGGKCKKVRIPETRTPDEIRAEIAAEFDEKMREIDLAEYRRGSWLVTIGLLIVSVAVALHCVTSLPQVKQIAWGVGLLGIGVAGAGFVQKKTVEFDGHLWWTLVIVFGLGIAYKMRNWSVTHVFKRNNPADENAERIADDDQQEGTS